MSDLIEQAVAALGEKLGGGIDGSVKFVLTGAGSIVADGAGVRAADDETDVTLTADPDVFRDLLEGNLNPTTAFMTGKLSVDGDMGMAMKLGSLLG